MNKIDENYILKVADYQPVLLPRPKKKEFNIILINSGEDDKFL